MADKFKNVFLGRGLSSTEILSVCKSELEQAGIAELAGVNPAILPQTSAVVGALHQWRFIRDFSTWKAVLVDGDAAAVLAETRAAIAAIGGEQGDVVAADDEIITIRSLEALRAMVCAIRIVHRTKGGAAC